MIKDILCALVMVAMFSGLGFSACNSLNDQADYVCSQGSTAEYCE